MATPFTGLHITNAVTIMPHYKDMNIITGANIDITVRTWKEHSIDLMSAQTGSHIETALQSACITGSIIGYTYFSYRTWLPNGYHSYFVFGRSRVQTSTRRRLSLNVFVVFLSPSRHMPRPLPSISFPIHFH
jgi:hypothetical protein